MRSVKSLVAAGAASLLSSIAFAADMPSIAPSPMYAPAPIEDFGGWYLRGDIGFSNQSVKKLDWFSYPTLLSLNQNTGFDTAGIFGLGVGYQFNNWFRMDVIGQWRGRANFHGSQFTDAFAGSALVNNYSGSKSEAVIMANGYFDLGTWWCVTPYIGAPSRSQRTPSVKSCEVMSLKPIVWLFANPAKFDTTPVVASPRFT